MVDDSKNTPTKAGLRHARGYYAGMPSNTTLKLFLSAYLTNFRSINSMAESMGLSHGSITHVLNGAIDDSPSLRNALGILKNPRRWRVMVDVDEELFCSFKSACASYELTPRELLLDMLNVYDDVMSNMPY